MATDQGAAPDAIARRLAADERLIWWDRPDPVGFAKYEVNASTLFGAVFFCFALFWMSQASRVGGFFFLFGLPFILLGLWLVTAPLRGYRTATRTLFALTDKRTLVVNGASASTRPLEQMPFVETVSTNDGSGSVLFFNEPMSLGWNFNQQAMTRKSGFIAIRDAERVGQEMLALMEQRRRSAVATA